MNTAHMNAPATVISVVVLLTALLMGAEFRNSGLLLAYLIPVVLLLEPISKLLKQDA